MYQLISITKKQILHTLLGDIRAVVVMHAVNEIIKKCTEVNNGKSGTNRPDLISNSQP